MAYYGLQSHIRFWAWDTANNIGVAGDTANFTLTLTRDGSDSVFAGAVTDLGGGLYSALVSATLMQANEVSIRGTSTTADVTIFPIETLRTVRLPNVEPGIVNGLCTMESVQVTFPSGITSTVVLPKGLQAKLELIEKSVTRKDISFTKPQLSPGDPGGLALATDDGVLTSDQQTQLNSIVSSLLTIGQTVWEYVGSAGRTLTSFGFNTIPSATQSQIDFIQKMEEADVIIDRTTSPFEMVWKEKGTETELLRKQLYDFDGIPVTSTNQPIGEMQ